MLNVQMSPGAREASPTNGIGQVILNYAKHLSDFGVRLVSAAESHDLTSAHAGEAIADVAHLHGLVWTSEQPATQDDHIANRKIVSAIRHARAVTVPSQWVAECLRRDMHLNPYVIPHGVDVAEWEHADEHDGYVLWNKNRYDVVCDPEPVARLAALVPAARFISTFCTNPKPTNVDVTGLVAFPRMKRLIQRASIYLATTRETGRIGVLEAMAAGVPVLGFDWGDTADIVAHKVNGYLVDPGDYMALAEGLEYCYYNWYDLSDAAHETAKAWPWSRAAEAVAEVYKSVAQPVAPIVRVVIPCHNKAATVAESIKSVDAQTWAGELQCVVVDDCSSDGSTDVAYKTVVDSKRLKFLSYVIPRDHKGTVARARNNGVWNLANLRMPKYLVFLDADDLIAPTFVETCIRAMESDPTLGVAYTGLRFIQQAANQSSGWPKDYRYDWQLAGQNQVPTCCMIRYEAFKRAGGYNPIYCPTGAGVEDAELWLRLGALGWGGKQVTREPLFIYRPGGSTQRPGYKELDWRFGHPWTVDFQHPFASIASPRSGIAHPVRSYEQPRVSVFIHEGEPEAMVHTLRSLEAQTDRGWEAVDCDMTIDDGPMPPARFPQYPYFLAHLPKARTIVHTNAGEWLYSDLIAQVAARGGRWRYEGYRLWQM